MIMPSVLTMFVAVEIAFTKRKADAVRHTCDDVTPDGDRVLRRVVIFLLQFRGEDTDLLV